ncbi:BTB/POZ fold protein [Metarhizium album ARSEF 1941]|uniref:BTB/POZ fold protein n=1 Tax=Metarhizium album (strain ARSEF 1941) TaxID=1081103 RepID=A0A0B2WYH3_METAS|nr:BTB/POZ fold protein [Metarhizium album ARSEF 1941]KHN98477.1 BTB/POZ fold protein [Metarhizium album ARSEF 1941]
MVCREQKGTGPPFARNTRPGDADADADSDADALARPPHNTPTCEAWKTFDIKQIRRRHPRREGVRPSRNGASRVRDVSVVAQRPTTSYFNTGTLCDVTIVCDGQEFKVHGVILSAHSRYFAAELTGNWRESFERKIEIKDFDATVVEAMLRFMYFFDYSNIYSTSTMIYYVQVYQIADKYDIPALKAHAKEKFGVSITTGWSLDDYPLAIAVVYESTAPDDRELRDLVVETSRKNIKRLLMHNGFNEVLRRVKGLGEAEAAPAL